ncbi:MAG: siderophore-interacting protein, partial [Aliarcobacter butzleri]
MNTETKIKEEATYWLILEKEGLNNEQKEKLNLWLKDENNKKAYN